MITILSKQDAGVQKNLTEVSSPGLTKKSELQYIPFSPIRYIDIYGCLRSVFISMKTAETNIYFEVVRRKLQMVALNGLNSE